jgi:hypothetical protein
MSLKDKIMNKITAHPKLTTLGIGLVITFVVGLAIGAVDNNVVFAAIPHTSGCHPPGDRCS